MKDFMDALIRSVAANMMALVAWFVLLIYFYGAPPIIGGVVAIGGLLASAIFFGMMVTKGYEPRQLHLTPIIIGWLLPLTPFYFTMRDGKDSDIWGVVMLFLFVAAGVISTYTLRFPKSWVRT